MGLQRRVKLGFIARKSLLRKGKKDAKKKVVQNNKFPISPFFDEEIAVCIANLHKEYEKYLKYKTKLTNKISKYDKKSNQFTAHIRMLDNESTYQKSILENLNKIVFDEVDVKNSESKRLASFFMDFENIIRLLHNIVKPNKYMVFTVGNRHVHKLEVPFDEILSDIASHYGFEVVYDFRRNILKNKIYSDTKAQNFKTIKKETVIVLRKTDKT